ncbi:MAG: HAD hydrolase-like protein [Clostridia bacterium]|nr:HAD hydrolase-like protein [Clostridia bacterium]
MEVRDHGNCGKKQLILLTDIGDTVIDETTEVTDKEGIVVRAGTIEGAEDAYLEIYRRGYTVCMVADGYVRSFHNTMDQHGLSGIFSGWVISEEVGEDKPSEKMFQEAFRVLGLEEKDKHRVVMIGNNVGRDILGANRFGIRSILMDWSKKRPYDEHGPLEHPTYRIHSPKELPELLDRLEEELQAGGRDEDKGEHGGKTAPARQTIHFREQRVLAYVKQYLNQHGVAPTVRQVASALGIGLAAAHRDIHALTEHGELIMDDGKARTLRLPEEPVRRGPSPARHQMEIHLENGDTLILEFTMEPTRDGGEMPHAVGQVRLQGTNLSYTGQVVGQMIREEK